MLLKVPSNIFLLKYIITVVKHIGFMYSVKTVKSDKTTPYELEL